MSVSESVLTQVTGLAGYLVNQCIVDYALSLALSRGERTALLRIEGAFFLRLDREWELDASTGPSALCPSLGLFGRTIESAKLVRTGELELAFSGGGWIRVAKGREYEAWSLSMSDKTLIVSGVDGKVSVFREEERGRTG
jgi:hypothetical protein